MEKEIKVNFSKHQFELINETSNSIAENISKFQQYQTEKDIFCSETEKDLVLRRQLLFILNGIDKFINYVIAGINSDDIDKDGLFPVPGKHYKCDSKNIGILVSIARISRTDYTIIDMIDDTYIIVFEK